MGAKSRQSRKDEALFSFGRHRNGQRNWAQAYNFYPLFSLYAQGSQYAERVQEIENFERSRFYDPEVFLARMGLQIQQCAK